MASKTELTAFWVAVGFVLVIPIVGGAVGAFGGIEGLAALFRVRGDVVVAPELRNHLRAICWMFEVSAAIAVWSLRSIAERAGAFRIVLGLGVAAGFARLTGWYVDGAPGPVATAILCLELGYLPLLLLWHARLVRLSH